MKSRTIIAILLIFLLLFSLVGCSAAGDITTTPSVESPAAPATEPTAEPTIEPTDPTDIAEDHRTGPISEYCRVFSTNSDFVDWVSTFNTQGSVYLSFNFDSCSSIGEATYLFETITDLGSEQLYDYQTSFGYSFRYTFYSNYYPPELGIDHPTFSINCVYPCLDENLSVKAINEESISFQLTSVEENTYAYTVMSGDVELMELTIQVALDGQVTAEDVLQLLQDNIVFIS